MMSRFFRFFTFSCFLGTFAKNSMKKCYYYRITEYKKILLQISEIHLKIFYFAEFYDPKPDSTKMAALLI